VTGGGDRAGGFAACGDGVLVKVLPERLERPVVVGVAGAPGSGKSSVARMLGEAGCVHVDFDAEAKAALELPEVKEKLRAAWGERVVSASGEVDKAGLAGIVFGDEGERRRLESMTHPVVWRTRGEARAEAGRAGAWGIVLDAALLFEVGLDAECDVVVFVESPREARLQRVSEWRGWDSGELDRREAAQLAASEKRERSSVVVLNDGSVVELARRTGEVCAMLRGRLATASSSPESGGR